MRSLVRDYEKVKWSQSVFASPDVVEDMIEKKAENDAEAEASGETPETEILETVIIEHHHHHEHHHYHHYDGFSPITNPTAGSSNANASNLPDSDTRKWLKSYSRKCG